MSNRLYVDIYQAKKMHFLREERRMLEQSTDLRPGNNGYIVEISDDYDVETLWFGSQEEIIALILEWRHNPNSLFSRLEKFDEYDFDGFFLLDDFLPLSYEEDDDEDEDDDAITLTRNKQCARVKRIQRL